MLINSGRTEPCKDTLGGIRSVYIWSWSFVPFYLIRGVRGVSLDSYPTTDVYKLEVSSGDYNENLIEDNAYEQSLTLSFPKITNEDNFNFNKYQNINIGCVIEDRNGIFRLMGAERGCSIDNLNVSLGGAHADFNGYKMDISAKERFSAPLFNDLSAAGFILSSETFYLLSDLGEILTDENGNRLTYA